MTEPVDEPVYAIRVGGGLMRHMPMSDERRAQQEREDEREAQQAEFEAQIRRERAAERRWELERQGVAARTVGEVIAAASIAQDRTDRREDKRNAEWEAAQINPPKPQWITALAAAKTEREAREAAAEVTPATEAAVDRKIKKLANAVWNATGKQVL
jgi:hypothetical protein